MSERLGSAMSVRRRLKVALMLRGWERRGRDHWVAQSESKRVAVEVIGDPVRQVSLVLPTGPGAGTILGQFLNEYSGEGVPARAWAEATLAAWSDRLAGDVTDALDETRKGLRNIRLQSLGAAAVVATVTVFSE